MQYPELSNMSARVEQGEVTEEEVEATNQDDDDDDVIAQSAPFSLRCGALLIDYILLIGIIVGSTLFARSFGDTNSRLADSWFNRQGQIIAVVVTILNFFVLAWLRGQTLGKWATGLRIRKKDGSRASFLSILLRHLIGYPISTLLLFMGFLIAAVTSNGRALHDYIAGTIVVLNENFDEE